MKTTLVIPDPVMARLRAEAARRGRTISELVEEALRRLLDEAEPGGGEVPPLPAFDGGRPAVDLANREALEHVMEG
ncbi:MAG: ribbon-helix-helix protein, CopG family [Gemmatimonadetes bacterium]|nr:ribbon-helix-helix protein, CopG family [Gemmatimonadota bacterium]